MRSQSNLNFCFVAAEHADGGAPAGGDRGRAVGRRGGGSRGGDPGHRGDVHGRGPCASAVDGRGAEDAGGGDPVPAVPQRALL